MDSIIKMVMALCLAAFGTVYFLTHGGRDMLLHRAEQSANGAAGAAASGVNAAATMAASQAQQAQIPSSQIPSSQIPAPQPMQGVGAVTLVPDQFNQYHADIEINGRRVAALVDTGASMVALRAEDAEAMSIYPAAADFKLKMSTANGISLAAPVTLGTVRLGAISVSNVQAVVAQRGALTVNLLGMTFMKKLASFEVAQGKLVLHP